LSEREASLERLARAARWTELRLKLDEALRRAALVLPIPLVYAVGALTYIKVARPAREVEETLLFVGLLPVVVLIAAVLEVVVRRRAPHAGALALDRHHALYDRITNALSFRELPPERRTSLMEAAIDDAIATARKLEPRRAAPLALPRELLLAGVLVVALIGIGLLEVRSYRPLPPERAFDPLVMTGDDIELFREMAQELEQQNQDPETLAAARRFNQLVEDIAQRRLDRREVFQRLEELERELARGAEADREALEEGLKSLAKELEKSDLSKPMAQPLAEKRLADAEKAMRELAEKLKRKQKPPDKAELEKLRKALEKASQTHTDRQKRLEQERKRVEEERQSLLKKKKPDGGLDSKDQKQVEKKDRQLERLDREKKQADRTKRQLSKLDQELAKAAQDLMNEMGKSAQDLESGAEEMNRMAREQMSDQEKQQMLRRLQELRELVRQQGKGGQQRQEQMQRFGERARGRPSGGQGDSEQGQGQKPGGKQPGGAGGQELRLGRGSGEGAIPIPGSGQGEGPGQGEQAGMGQGENGQGRGDKPGEGAGQGGEEAGKGHDPNLKGERSGGLKGEAKDVTAVAADTGEGSASSQVIYGAAQRGFVGRGYKKVYTDYKTVAEQVMNQDDIPPGYRFYVQRYFQLIRPRE
jgi:hypothetical protein